MIQGEKVLILSEPEVTKFLCGIKNPFSQRLPEFSRSVKTLRGAQHRGVQIFILPSEDVKTKQKPIHIKKEHFNNKNWNVIKSK